MEEHPTLIQTIKVHQRPLATTPILSRDCACLSIISHYRTEHCATHLAQKNVNAIAILRLSLMVFALECHNER